MSDWTIFGERLSHITRECDVSLRELSLITGIALTTLHRYAKCKRVPKATEILKCADALGIAYDYLLGLSDDPHLTEKGERIIGKACNKSKRKTGKWIFPYETTRLVSICSECGAHGRGNFCSNCGADMRG